MPLYALGDRTPSIHPDAFIHPDAVVIGDVRIGADSSVWPSAVLRGDYGTIIVGERTSIQDGAIIHAVAEFPTVIGERLRGGPPRPPRGLRHRRPGPRGQRLGRPAPGDGAQRRHRRRRRGRAQSHGRAGQRPGRWACRRSSNSTPAARTASWRTPRSYVANAALVQEGTATALGVREFDQSLERDARRDLRARSTRPCRIRRRAWSRDRRR